MPALDNLTKSENIATTARIINFVTSFNDDWSRLREIMGIMRPIRRAPGTVLKSKYAEMTLESGAVAEGSLIPFSKASVKEKPYEEITIEKYAKSVSLEAIHEHGYGDAVLRTEQEFRRQLISATQNKFYTFLQSGTLTGAKPTFQEVISESQRLILDKWDKMGKNITEIVAFANYKDVYDYLGAANISTQTQFGMTYLENFMGIRRLFMSSRIPAGTLLATPTNNIVLYYVDPADSEFARAGLQYTAYSDIPGVPAGAQNLIGYHVQGDYARATSNSYAITGISLFAEYIDGIAVVDLGTESFTAVSSPTGNPSDLKYYEKDAGNNYFRSTDTEVDSEKTYYSRTVTAGE